MLGHWSLGDYFKEDAIRWSFEFLTSPDCLGIPVEKLAVSVFAGDETAPRDEESARIWEECGIPRDKIFFLPRKNNWWGPAGLTGPCGPDTEMFIDRGYENARRTAPPPATAANTSRSGTTYLCSISRTRRANTSR